MAYQKKPDQPNDRPATEPAEVWRVEPDDQTSRAMTIADVLSDPMFESVWIGAQWNDRARSIIVTVRAQRAMTSAEYGMLVEMIRANGHKAAAQVFEEFVVTLETPLTFVGSVGIHATAIDITVSPENNRRED